MDTRWIAVGVLVLAYLVQDLKREIAKEKHKIIDYMILVAAAAIVIWIIWPLM